MSAALDHRATAALDPVEVFRARAEARAMLYAVGELDLHESVDVLQRDAERTGLNDAIGADRVQQILATAFSVVRKASP